MMHEEIDKYDEHV